MKDIAFNDTARVHLLHPTTGEELYYNEDPCVIVVYGSQSDVFRSAKLAMNNRVAANKGPMTAEKQEQLNLEFLAACTAGLENVVDDKGTAYTQETAKKLYRKRAWVRQQVDEAIVDDARFLISDSDGQNSD